MTITSRPLTSRQILDLTVRELFTYAHQQGRNPLDVLRDALATL